MFPLQYFSALSEVDKLVNPEEESESLINKRFNKKVHPIKKKVKKEK